jgi:hypothetical protein
MTARPEEVLREATAPGMKNKNLFYLQTELKARKRGHRGEHRSTDWR